MMGAEMLSTPWERQELQQLSWRYMRQIAVLFMVDSTEEAVTLADTLVEMKVVVLVEETVLVQSETEVVAGMPASEVSHCQSFFLCCFLPKLQKLVANIQVKLAVAAIRWHFSREAEEALAQPVSLLVLRKTSTSTLSV